MKCSKYAPHLIGLAMATVFMAGCAQESSKNVTEKPSNEQAIPVINSQSTSQTEDCDDKLNGVVIIIDPGHGGQDPGAHAILHGEHIYEAPYVNDVALRLVQRVRQCGGVPMLTRRSSTSVSNAPQKQILTLNRNDRFRDNTQVVAGKRGMQRRLSTIRAAESQFPGRKIVWVSIHFDSLPKRINAQGVSFLIPSDIEHSTMTNALVQAFDDEHRIRIFNRGGVIEERPLTINENVRNVFILRHSRNTVKYRYLVELGNFSNDHDRWRIRDSSVRAEYAELIIKGIEEGL